MEQAVLAAASDAGLDGPPPADSIRVVEPALAGATATRPRFLAARLGLEPAELGYTAMGGNSPQSLVNATSLDIQAGKLDVAILTGGESWRTFMRARKAGVDARLAEGARGRRAGHDRRRPRHEPAGRDRTRHLHAGAGVSDVRDGAAGRGGPDRRGAPRPSRRAVVRPQPRRRPATSTRGSAMPSRPRRSPRSPPTNRMIGLPVSEVHELEQRRRHGRGDHHVLGRGRTTAGHRRGSLGVPALGRRLPRAHVRVPPRHVRPHAGDRARRRGAPSNSPAWASTTSPSSTCTPASPPRCSSARRRSASTSSRQWSRTGGLPFAGGPWNNYVMHAIASVVNDLREQPGEHGLVWANGGYATKHAFGVYSTDAAGQPVPPREAAGRDRPAAAPRAGVARRCRGTGDDRGLHGDVLPRRRTRTAARLVSPRRRSAGLGIVDRRRHRRRDVRRRTGRRRRHPLPRRHPPPATDATRTPRLRRDFRGPVRGNL